MSRLKDKDGTPAWKWGKKASSVNVANLNSNIIQYLDTLPQGIQDRILATSGNDSGHAKTSRHYSDSAIDLRFDQDIWNHIEKDPNRLKYGLTLINPNHGTGKHIHLSYGDGSENTKDVWMNPYSTQAKDMVGMQSVPSSNPSLIPSNNTQIFMNDDSNRAEFLRELQEQMKVDAQLDAQQKQQIAVEQARQQSLLERTRERNSILDAIGDNNLEFEGRNYKPNQNFADGGVVDGLDDDIDFMIQSLKSDMPEAESPEYLSLVQENEALQNKMNKDWELYDSLSSELSNNQPTIINNQYGALPTSGSVGQSMSDSPEKIANLSSTKGLLYTELKNLGLNNIQIAGAIGSLGGESHEHLEADLFNEGGSGAYGIAQWLGPRYRNLVKYSKEQGLDHRTPQAQVKFLVNELQGSERGTLNSLKNAKDISQATEIWTRKYERPSEKEVRDSLGRRVKFAQNFLNSIS